MQVQAVDGDWFICTIGLEQLQNTVLESSLTLDIIAALDSHEVAQACREIKYMTK